MDTIIIDDLPQISNNVIDLDNYNSDDVIEISDVHDDQAEQYEQIARDDQLLWSFIQKCLEIEHSEGMHRVISRSLLPVYKKTTKELRNSASYRRIITRAICNVARYPYLKFSHVKELCDSMRHVHLKQFNKKLIKSPVVREEPREKRQKLLNKKKYHIKKHKRNGHEKVVNLDHDYHTYADDKESIQYNQQTGDEKDDTKYHNDNKNIAYKNVTIIDTVPIEFIQIDHDIDDSTKKLPNVEIENNNVSECDNIPSELTQSEEKESCYRNFENSIATPIDTITTICLSDEEVTDEDVNSSQPKINGVAKLLVPYKELYSDVMEEDRIKKIEEDIQMYKNKIEILEQQEVLEDTYDSSYIQCEKMKERIVVLYRQLCTLTGEKPVKRREVRLTATNILSPLTVQKLEEFINSNIGSDGLPLFPDFCDVVKCVQDANRIGKMGWPRSTVMQEARALFTHCGRALQQNRQRREWRDMLILVKKEAIEDPADHDPDLMARLQANKRQASVKENELLNRYSNMQQNEPGTEENDFQNTYDEESPNQLITPKGNPYKRVRITPIPVLYDPKSHKISKIVKKSNQVVEVVISDDKKRINGDNTNIVTSQTPVTMSPSKMETDPVFSSSSSLSMKHGSGCNNVTSTSENNSINFSVKQEPASDKSVTTGENAKLVKSQTSVIVSHNKIGTFPVISSIFSLSSKHESGYSNVTSTSESNSINLSDKQEPASDNSDDTSVESQALRIKSEHKSTSNPNNIMKSSSKFSSCSISLLHTLAGVKNWSSIYEKTTNCDNVVNAPKHTDNNQKEKLASQINNNSEDIGRQLIVKIRDELDQPNHVREENSIDETCKANKSAIDVLSASDNDESLSILEHFLKAKVVLPKMIIKYENIDNNESNSNKDSNDEPIIASSDHGNEENELIPKESIVKIKEEPCIDIQKELDELGDDFTTTIIDIEDPFLVVEISSDSSEDEMEFEEIENFDNS